METGKIGEDLVIVDGWIVMYPCPARLKFLDANARDKYATSDKSIETPDFEKAHLFMTEKEARLRANKHPRAKADYGRPRLLAVKRTIITKTEILN